ncbi:MAG: fasciclin domain-containing protein [Steroidobacteraceae bacterium]
MKSASVLAFLALLAIAVPNARASETTLAQALASNPDLSTLNSAIEAAGLGDALAGASALTVLAPTNEAFAALPAGTLDGLLAPERKADLVKLLQGHVLGVAYTADSLKTRRSVATLAGTEIKPGLVRGKLRINEDARVAGKAIKVANGYVLLIDKVLVP